METEEIHHKKPLSEAGAVYGIHHALKLRYEEASIRDIVSFFVSLHFFHDLIAVLIQYGDIFPESPVFAGNIFNRVQFLRVINL